MYYVEYILKGKVGAIYCLDTGFGVIELGTMEGDKIWGEQHFFERIDVRTFLKNTCT